MPLHRLAAAAMELLSFETLGYILAAKLAWSLLIFLKNLLTGFGVCGAVDPKNLGEWAVGTCKLHSFVCLDLADQLRRIW